MFFLTVYYPNNRDSYQFHNEKEEREKAAAGPLFRLFSAKGYLVGVLLFSFSFFLLFIKEKVNG